METMKRFVKQFHHFGLPAKDMDATIEFYRKLGADIVFETTVQEAGKPCRVVHLQVANLYVEAYERDETPGMPGAVDHLALETDDVDAAFAEAKRLGFNLINEKVDVSDYWPGTAKWFHIVGPNGEKIEFTR